MSFTLATFNVRDLFDDQPPRVIGGLDEGGRFGALERAYAARWYDMRLAHLASVLERMDADVVGFQEVKSAQVLDALRARLPARHGVPCGGYLPALAAAPDRRGISVGMLTRFPVQQRVVHQAEQLAFPSLVRGDPAPFGVRLYLHRPVLEATVTLPEGEPLDVLVVHLKSALPMPLERADGSTEPFTTARSLAEGAARSLVTRVAEGLFVRELVDRALERSPRRALAVLGDFNDREESVPVRAVLGDTSLLPAEELARSEGAVVARWQGRALHACARMVPAGERFSLVFRGQVQQVDHVLVSEALWQRCKSARFLNETLVQQQAGPVLKEGLPVASDHAPLCVELR